MRELIELLGMIVSEDKSELQWPQKTEILFFPGSLPSKMLELLKNAELPYDFYKMQYLENCYEKFMEDKKQEFALLELFNDKWLICCGDEWSLNIGMRSSYDRIGVFPSSREEQIVDFLKILAKTPYRNSARLHVMSVMDLPEGITEVEDGKAYINPYSKYWENLGSLVLGQWWSEIASQSEFPIQRQEQVAKWFYCWRMLRHCWNPEAYTTYSEELFEVCLEVLEQEKNTSSWEKTKSILERKFYVEYESARGKNPGGILDDFPETVIGRILYIEQRISWWGFINPYEYILQLFHLCVRLYGCVSSKLRHRFLKCMSVPCLCQEIAVQRKHVGLLADCLEEPGLFVVSAHAIWQILYDKMQQTPYAGKYLVEEACKYLLAIMERNLRKNGFGDRWQQELAELFWYFSEEGPCGFQDNTGMRKYIKVIHEIALQWYAKVIAPQEHLNEVILQYFESRFNTQTGLNAIHAFVEYVSLANLRKENRAVKAFRIYQQLMERVTVEDFLLSQVLWSFWQSSIWIDMMRKILSRDLQFTSEQYASNTEGLVAFCNLLTPSAYKAYIKTHEGKSPILDIGKAGMIHLYMLTILFIELHDQLNKSQRERAEAAFTDCFLGFQVQGCDPFSVESMRLLEAESVALRCMEAFSMISESRQDKIITFLKKEPVEKILFYIDYVDKQELREKLLSIVVDRMKESFTNSIFFLPTWQNLIDHMIDICFHHDEKRLIPKIGEVLAEFEKAVESKGKRVKEGNELWIKEKRIQLEILLGNENQVLEEDSVPVFYKAFIYLNQEDLESLKKAEQLYAQYLKPDSPKSSVYINYFASCVRICTHAQASETDKLTYLPKAQKTAEFIWEKCVLTLRDKELLCSNELFLYSVLKDNCNFWKAGAHLPEELQYKISCGVYYVEMYAWGGEKERAEAYLDELIFRYGETDQLIRLRRKIETQENMQQLAESAKKPMPVTEISDNQKDIQRLREAYNQMSKLTERDCALVRLQKTLVNPEETNLLEMVLNAIAQMEQYSGYLMLNEKTAHENSYNKFVQILFNQRQTELWNYHLRDQSQEGTATGMLKDGRESVGSPDLVIYHRNDPIGIIEAIKLRSADEKQIEKHIRKVTGYNFANVETAFLLVLVDYQYPSCIWESYVQRVDEIIGKTAENTWQITKRIPLEEMELFKLGILNKKRFCFMTVHECRNSGKKFHMYHIMADISKSAEREEAIAARNL